MRLCVFDGGRLGVVLEGDRVVDVSTETDAVDDPLRAVVDGWERMEERLAAAAEAGEPLPLDSVRLEPPVPRPSKIVAAPVNYREHQREMGGEAGVYEHAVIAAVDEAEAFLKAPSSLIGPGERIRLPDGDRRVDYEGELGVVMGRTARAISAEEALEYVFGYVPLLDVTLRGPEDRSFRKSFDTFTPVGPALTTAGEVGDPMNLDLRLWLNGELRQETNTAEMIRGVPELIERMSRAMTLLPGDLIATGTPAGVGKLAPGDEIVLAIERVGTLTMAVA